MEEKKYEFVDSVEKEEALLKRVREAQKVFATYTQEQVDKIFLAAAEAANQARIPLAKMAVQETGMGCVEDKVTKNHYAAEYIYNKYRYTKTVGVIEEDKVYGIKRIAEPLGVIGAVIPTTNPTSTAIFKTLISLKTRNGIIISPHPRAKKCTVEAAKIVLEAAVKAGAPKGIIGFNRLTVRTPQFALPIRMRKTSVTVGNRAITLRNASMRIGRSNLTASGAVHDLYGAMKHHRMLRANLEISSRNLDCNQLINSLNFPQDTLQAEVDTASSDAPMELFVIPKNIDFELQTNLKRVTYGKMVFENVNGAVDVRNQAVHLKNLSMRGLDADMRATLVYRAKRKARGYAGFDFRLKRINIGRLVEFAPSLDTIVPMLRSFKGTVDFEAAAETVLDSALNIKIPSLRAAVHIKGDSLVLMDGETFAEISKKLLFKNKERNVFDSISVNLTVDDGDVTIYPFVVQIDRYKAAVGGTQGLDMNFDYHISILKSPVPFKLGLNISGNLDDMKFRLGKAKYKDAVTPVAIRKVDSTRVNMGRNIVRDFEQVMNRSGGRMSAKAREAE